MFVSDGRVRSVATCSISDGRVRSVATCSTVMDMFGQ